MKPLLAGIAFFVAINVVAAATMLIAGQFFSLLDPEQNDALPWFLAGLAGVAAGILFAKFLLSVIARLLASNRARARE